MFHSLVEKSEVLDIEDPIKCHQLFKMISDNLADKLKMGKKEIFDKLVEREKDSSTVIRKGLAIPHIMVESKNIFELLIVRAKSGVIFPEDNIAHIVFVIAGSRDERNFHLQVLAAIAQVTQQPEFDKKWQEALNTDDLKNIVLLSERRRI